MQRSPVAPQEPSQAINTLGINWPKCENRTSRPLTQPECYWAKENQLHLAGDRTIESEYILEARNICSWTVSVQTYTGTAHKQLECLRANRSATVNKHRLQDESLSADIWSVCPLHTSPLSGCIIFLLGSDAILLLLVLHQGAKLLLTWPGPLLLSIRLTEFHLGISVAEI